MADAPATKPKKKAKAEIAPAAAAPPAPLKIKEPIKVGRYVLSTILLNMCKTKIIALLVGFS